MLRVISGIRKGIRLRAVPGKVVRPTQDRVKEAIFNMIAGFEYRKVLDLFAGTGSLGIEALSRGAESAFFVDNSSKSIETIKDNLKLTGFSGQAKVIKMDALKFLRNLSSPVDLIFADPPYKRHFLDLLAMDMDSLEIDGLFVYETDEKEEISGDLLNLVQVQQKRFGSTRVYIFRKAG